MLILHVHVHVKPDYIEAFKEASIENANHSRKEPGIARFDVLQQEDDPTRFVLIEVYRNEKATAAHKETAHYAAWRQRVEPLMAEPRTRAQYNDVVPAEPGR